MATWIIWLIVAATLVVTEVLTQMMWALCLAIGSLAAMICSLFGLDMTWQVSALIAASVLAYLVLLPVMRQRHNKRVRTEARTGMDALLGRRAIVTHEILPGKIGRARIDGDNWQVVEPGIQEKIPQGKEVIVTSYDSIILNVTLPD